MIRRLLAHGLMLFGLILVLPWMASAQVVGPFSWQLQPYCNIVTVTLTRGPAGFTLDGTEDQCGAFNKASAFGVASFNGGGFVTVNFTIVTAPSGKPVHVSAVVRPDTGHGTWTDSAGNAGTLAFFGTAPGLPPRPLPASGLPPSVVTTAEIANGTVGAADINTAQVQARVTGACAQRQLMTGINANGTVSCDESDDGGRLSRSTFSSLTLPTTVGGSGVLLSQVVDLPGRPRRALVRARGHCNIESSTTSPVVVQLEIAPTNQPVFAAVTADQGILFVPQESTAVMHTVGYTAELEIAVISPSQFYFASLFGRHLNGDGSNNTTCWGTMTAQSYLP